MARTFEEKRIYNRKYYKAHSEVKKAIEKKYREIHREAINEKGKKYYVEHRNEIIARRKKYHAKYPEKTRIHCKKYYIRHREELIEYAKTYRLELKKQVLTYYGYGKLECAICHDTRIDVLSIDHINGKGNQHRKQIGHIGSSFYSWLIKNECPPGFRTLCYNSQILEYARKKGRMVEIWDWNKPRLNICEIVSPLINKEISVPLN